jgi:hypothetical protein
MALTVAGTLELSINGEIFNAKGEFTLRDDVPEREAIIGHDQRVHGYVETAIAPTLEGAITLAPGQDPARIKAMTNGTVIARFGNGKAFVINQAFFAGAGEFKTREHEMAVRFQGATAEWLN